MPKIVGGKDWAERVVDNARKPRFSLNLNANVMNANNALRAAASPYEVIVREDQDTYDIKIVLVDKRQEDPQKIMVTIPREITERDGGNIDGIVMRAVEQAKDRLQKKLAKNCDEPEIRLWAAKYRDVDLMDNSEIPSRIRIEYRKQNAVTEEKKRLSRQEIDRIGVQAIERSIESDSGPVHGTPPPRARKIVRRPRVTIKGLEVAEEAQSKNVYGEPTKDEVKPTVPVAKVKGAHSKTPMRKPRCKNREHDDAPEMVYDPEEGVWKCPEGCGTIARPKSDSPVGTVQLGKGRLDLRVLFVEPGKKPSILLVADNNLALDITEYVEMDNFLKYSRAVQQAQMASNNGEKMVQVDMPAEKYVSAMLKFPGMRIYGCDNA